MLAAEADQRPEGHSAVEMARRARSESRRYSTHMITRIPISSYAVGWWRVGAVTVGQVSVQHTNALAMLHT